MSAEIKQLQSSSIASLGVGSLISLITVFVKSSSLQSMFTMLNMIQLILLLPLLDTFLTRKSIDFIRSLNFSFLNFSFLSLESLPHTQSTKEMMEIPQKNLYLFSIGLEYGSFIFNFLSLTGVLLLIPIIHILL